MLASGGSEPYYYTVWTNTVVAIGQEVNSLSQGNYTIHVKDNNNCTTSEAVYIGEPAPLEASVLVSNPSCMGSNDGFIQVVAAGGTEPYSYFFNEMKWFSSTYGNLVEGVYEVAVSDTSGCSYEVGKVTLNDSFLDCVLIPTAFSPNSDGINDKWEIRNFDNYPGAQVQVFNRWGQPVYSAISGQDPWDGTFDGKFVISGPYLYYVNLKNDTDPYTGTVTVVY
jgi:gliding motility-associated-like protein